MYWLLLLPAAYGLYRLNRWVSREPTAAEEAELMAQHLRDRQAQHGRANLRLL